MDTVKKFQVYKSSAGSGKTFTLARAYLSLALSSKDTKYFRKILGLTFTVKAASEMKDRIISYLSAFAGRSTSRKDVESMMTAISDETGLSLDEIRIKSEAVLLEIIHAYGDFSILTIDKFVNRIVRSFSSDLGLSSDFEIEIDPSKIIEQVLDRLMNQIGPNQLITPLVLDFVKNQVDEQKSWNVNAQLEMLAREILSEDFYLNAHKHTSINPESIGSIQKRIQLESKELERRLSEIGNSVMDMISLSGLVESDFYYGNRGIIGYFKKAQIPDLAYISSPNKNVVKTIEENKWQSKTKNDAVLKMKSELLNFYAEIQSLKPQMDRVIFTKKVRHFLYLLGLIGEVRRLFDAVRDSENIQMLSDYYRILSDKFAQEHSPFIYERLGQRYSHILIDEFQDTSTLQWKNLLPLVENSLSEGNTSLIVGDAKQSIYRFRGSEPDQFIQLPKGSENPNPLLSSTYKETFLETNFRSYSNIIDFNNRFFESIHKEFLSDQSALTYLRLKQKQNSRIGGEVYIHTIKKDEEIDRIDSFFLPLEQRISAILKSGKYKEKDVCLLFQKNSTASFIAGGLLEMGYKVTSSESLMLVNNPKIQLLIATLYAVHNSSDQFHLHQWLSRLDQSGLLKLNYHETASWVKKNKPRMYEVLNKINLKLNIEQCKLDPYRALSYLVDFFQMNPKDLFIRKLLDCAIEFEANSVYLKTSFLKKWETDKAMLCIDASAETNAIKVMTIHKSKGLEFPVVLVYLPEINIRKTTKSFIWLNECEDVPELSYSMIPTIALNKTKYDGLYNSELEKTKLDLLNSIYVAFTRAEQHLEIFTLQKNDKPLSKELEFITNWPEWNEETKQLHIPIDE